MSDICPNALPLNPILYKTIPHLDLDSHPQRLSSSTQPTSSALDVCDDILTSGILEQAYRKIDNLLRSDVFKIVPAWRLVQEDMSHRFDLYLQSIVGLKSADDEHRLVHDHKHDISDSRTRWVVEVIDKYKLKCSLIDLSSEHTEDVRQAFKELSTCFWINQGLGWNILLGEGTNWVEDLAGLDGGDESLDSKLIAAGERFL
jgi:hypothetical protein